MRLISKDDAAIIAKDPKAAVKTYYVEKAKGNTIPKHFMAEENKDKKTLTINGEKVVVGRNKERSEYCAFTQGDQSFYIRDHSFIDAGTNFVTFVKPEKPKPEPKVKKEKAEKPAKAEKTAKSTGKSSAASEKAARDAKNGGTTEPATEGDTGAA